ncbi:hypothetical protein CN213_34765 [Sinorhizobium meliloti]|nr:hypothetical protein CN213_34765 [Sinorhizobium meliloti]
MGAQGNPAGGAERSADQIGLDLRRHLSAKGCGGVGLVVPRCNTAMMPLHLDEIAAQVAPGAHALLMMDPAGWHMIGKLQVPDNITILPLPPKAPELNPVENIWPPIFSRR